MTGLRARRTYWHLQELADKPDEYAIVTSRLLHDEGRTLEIDAPVSPWYAAHARGSFLYDEKLEAFADPRRTTYRKYTELQAAQEQFVEGLLRASEAGGSDERLSEAWLDSLERVLPVLRFPVHGLQMATAYVAHVAPSGRLVVAGAFQCANELRRLQCFARRTHQLGKTRPGFGAQARAQWQDAPQWQLLRALIERLLVTYDFTEASIALQLVVKPMFDEVFMRGLSRSAAREGDATLVKLLFSLESDCEWQRECAVALFAPLLSARPELRERIDELRSHWALATRAALLVPLPLFVRDRTQLEAETAALDASRDAIWSSLVRASASAAADGSGGGDVPRLGV